MNHELMSAGYPYISIKERVFKTVNMFFKKLWIGRIPVKVQDRLSYYQVLNEASKGDIVGFERFVADNMDVTLDLYLDCTTNDKIERSYDNPQIGNYRDTIDWQS